MKLDDLGFVGRGKSKHRPRNDPSLYGGPYPFVQTGDVKEADLWLTQYTQTYNDKGLAQSKLWPVGTLCITIAANIAETAILKIPACFPDSIVGFVPHSGKADARFIKYYIDTLKVRMQNASKGTTQDNLSVDKLTTFDFAVPEFSVQERIASILSAYDDLIENNTRRIKILENMAQMLYREWFVNFRFPGHQKVRMVESEMGSIPQGWKTGILRDVCESMDYGHTASGTVDPIGPKFLRITDIVPATIDWQSVPYCPMPEKNPDKYLLKEGDIVVARTGATTGYAKRLNKSHPKAVFASYLVRLRMRSGFSNHLYGVLVQSDEYKRFIKANWSGAAQPQANAQVLSSIPIVIPPTSLQTQFSEVIQPLLDLGENLQIRTTNLRTTRDLLLPKLISGEIPVKAAEEAMEQTA